MPDPTKGVLELLAELDRLEAKATKGPWDWQRFGNEWCLTGQHGMRPIVLAVRRGALTSLIDGLLKPFRADHPDALLLCALRNAYPQLRAALTAPSQGGRWVPEEPTEEMWGELARDIMMWLDLYEGDSKTPRHLFSHLERCGRDIPQWLRDEPEMQALDHVPSKGTRCSIIYKAMLAAAPPCAPKDQPE